MGAAAEVPGYPEALARTALTKSVRHWVEEMSLVAETQVGHKSGPVGALAPGRCCIRAMYTLIELQPEMKQQEGADWERRAGAGGAGGEAAVRERCRAEP